MHSSIISTQYVLAASMAIILACATTTTTTPTSGSIATGKPLKLAVPDLSGDTVNLGADHGKVLLVDMWATWCEACKESLPYFQKLSKEFGKKGLLVYAISFDEKKESIAPYLKNVGVSVPVLWDNGGEKTSPSLGVLQLPTTILVDKTGTIRYVHQGYTAEIASQERQQIETLLAE
jgi:cytochrome c biogenesis protein CcmG, thiol:disulfide interchange protein DsbE